MSKIIEKSLDILLNPKNFELLFELLIAIFLTSLILLCTNFLPTEYLHKLHLETFLNNYDYILLIAFFSSLFLLIFNIIAKIKDNIENRKTNKFVREQQDKLFEDPEALSILKNLYENNPEAVYLSIYNQKVQLLEQFLLITKATNSALIDMFNPKFPYILQPIAEEKLKKLN